MLKGNRSKEIHVNIEKNHLGPQNYQISQLFELLVWMLTRLAHVSMVFILHPTVLLLSGLVNYDNHNNVCR